MPSRWRYDAKELRRDLSDPRELCEALGLLEKAKPQKGGGLFVCCPAHAERTPSCSVTRGADGTIRVCCFACGFTGDALHLIALARNIDIRTDFRGVLYQAATLAGRKAAPKGEARVWKATPAHDPARLPADKIDAVLRALLAASPLLADAQAAAYLLSRPSGKALLNEAAGAGWGAFPRDSAGRELARKLVGKFGKDILNLAELRMSTAGPVPLHPAYRLLIPFAGPDGLLHTIQRRRLDAAKPAYRFPTGYPALWPYGADLVSTMGPRTSVVYVEGAIDVLDRRAQYRAEGDDRLVLGIPGVASWHPAWATFAAGREARVALDADRAGEGAAPRLIDDLWQAGARTVFRTTPVDGRKDWNSRSRGHS